MRGNLLEANRAGKWPDHGNKAGAGLHQLHLAAPDKATAKDYVDDLRFQVRE